MWKRMAKILVVATTFPVSTNDSQPRFVLDLCKSLDNKVEQRVIVPSAAGLAKVSSIENIEVYRFRYFFKSFEVLAYGGGILENLKSNALSWLLVPFFLLGMIWEVMSQLKIFKPDVIHAHWWLPGGLASLIAIILSRSKCKLVLTCHGGDYFSLGNRFSSLMRWVFSRSTKVCMVSSVMANESILKGVPARKLAVAPMGVDLYRKFSNQASQVRHGVLFVGRLAEKKGVHVLLRAWSLLPPHIQALRLTIVGHGAKERELKELAIKLDVLKFINFEGSVNHQSLPDYYRRASLLVFPSIISSDNDQEGLGLVPIEAMGCRCPVLASRIEPLKDVIEENLSGYFFEMASAEDLAFKIDWFFKQSQSFVDENSDVAEKFVRSQYDWAKVADKYHSIYMSAISCDA
jgi:glycosyltransferase involved in cell wall biosynthesis